MEYITCKKCIYNSPKECGYIKLIRLRKDTEGIHYHGCEDYEINLKNYKPLAKLTIHHLI